MWRQCRPVPIRCSSKPSKRSENVPDQLSINLMKLKRSRLRNQVPPQKIQLLQMKKKRPPAPFRKNNVPVRTEAHDRADTHSKLLRSFRDGSAILPRTNNAPTQILRIRFRHPCWPPLQHKP